MVWGYRAAQEMRCLADAGCGCAALLTLYRYKIYTALVIVSFKCADTENLFRRNRVKRFVNIESLARRKLDQLHAAGSLDFLRVPPGNRLEALIDDRAGQHSIRVNEQFRLCFVWTPQGPTDVEIVDYH